MKSVSLERPNNGIGMKFNHLRDVLAVAERGSVRAAARELGVAQSALTRSIRELEKELGEQSKENRELLKMKIDLLREQIEKERIGYSRINFN